MIAAGQGPPVVRVPPSSTSAAPAAAGLRHLESDLCTSEMPLNPLSHTSMDHDPLSHPPSLTNGRSAAASLIDINPG